MSKTLVTGLHHVTAIADNAQENVDFYTGILGLRMVKKTVNFDNVHVYHLYYGNELGNAGTIMTFFPYAGSAQGRHGKGQLTATSFSVPDTSLDYWLKRLEKFKVKFSKPQQRFDDEVFVSVYDKDGLGLELIFNKTDRRKGFTYGQIPLEHSVKGFYGVTLTEEGYEKTGGLLSEYMDHKVVKEKGNRIRYSPTGDPGDIVDIVSAPDTLRGLPGSGTVHHVAFATPTDETQLQAREILLKKGFDVTPVIDRQYFHSIYFREPGGVLFEIATIPPGFAVDEAPNQLGEHLKLPSWEEENREEIESTLGVVKVQTEKYMD